MEDTQIYQKRQDEKWALLMPMIDRSLEIPKMKYLYDRAVSVINETVEMRLEGGVWRLSFYPSLDINKCADIAWRLDAFSDHPIEFSHNGRAVRISPRNKNGS
jgi:hypothetical protein